MALKPGVILREPRRLRRAPSCHPPRVEALATAREGDPFGRWIPFPSRRSAAWSGMTTLCLPSEQSSIEFGAKFGADESGVRRGGCFHHFARKNRLSSSLRAKEIFRDMPTG